MCIERKYLVCADLNEGIHPADDYPDYDERPLLTYEEFVAYLPRLSGDEVIFSSLTDEQLKYVTTEYGFPYELSEMSEEGD